MQPKKRTNSRIEPMRLRLVLTGQVLGVGRKAKMSAQQSHCFHFGILRALKGWRLVQDSALAMGTELSAMSILYQLCNMGLHTPYLKFKQSINLLTEDMSTHLEDAAAADPLAGVVDPIPTPRPQDPTWMLTCAFLALLGLFAFALLNAGSVRYKSTQSAVITVILGGVLTVIAFWLLGYGFAFGDDGGNGFIAYTKFAGAAYDSSEYLNDYARFTFYAVAATLVTSIFGQGTLERARFFSVSLCILFLQGFLYPVVLHWTRANGWLQKFGYVDFAGSGYVHAFGGMTALLTTFFLQHRRDKENPTIRETFPHHSPQWIGFGSLVLVFVLLAFTGGCDSQGEAGSRYLQAVITVNALIAAATGGLISFVANYFRTQDTSLIALGRGSVAGLVAVAASVAVIREWAAFLIGGFGGLFYLVLALALAKSPIDDPAQAASTHLVPGIWGILAVGLFSKDGGLFYGQGFTLFGAQCVGLLSILGWAVLILVFVIPLKGFGIFKILYSTEQVGIDQSYCGGEATVFIDQVPEPGLLSNTPKRQIFA